ncbi:uncharacterized protein LOC126895553 [Daktulosphaira vitifoliae]|uniref:uncharacterized protein LOC126895553 n=1 Tax=Daktulosphaira vitifoliae TaxID=58002 RepID=UPI0021AA7CBF|nr:uncharacterized protein LOC126895553 [Daktulosphaira vitifoliae]
MSIHGTGWSATPTGNEHGQTTYTANQIQTLLNNIEFRLRDLSNTVRRDQQIERINSRIDMIYNKLGHIEISNGLWFDKFQQTVTEECGSNHVIRRIDKTQQQLEITLEHMETTLQSVQNHQKDLEKEIRKIADKQAELSTEIQSTRKDISFGFERHNSSQIVFHKQLQDTVTNFTQQSKITDKTLNACQCNQNDDPAQSTEIMSNSKLISTMNSMINGLKDRSDDIHVLLKELVESTEKYRRRLDYDRQDVMNEYLDNFMENLIGEIVLIQKKSDNELEIKLKEQLRLLLDGQNLFINNCRRIQLNEHQIEDDIIQILERIFDQIDIKNTADNSTLEQIFKTMKAQKSWEEKRFEEISELSKLQSDQMVRTVAYSTNQVMKLHQDILNITNILMETNNNTTVFYQMGNNKCNSSRIYHSELKNELQDKIQKKITLQTTKIPDANVNSTRIIDPMVNN